MSKFATSEALRVAVASLREIAERPATELNPDGDEQAAYSMQLIARDTLDLIGEIWVPREPSDFTGRL